MTDQGVVALVFFLAGVVSVLRAVRPRRRATTGAAASPSGPNASPSIGATSDINVPAPMPAKSGRLRSGAQRAAFFSFGLTLVAIGGNSLPAFPPFRAPLLDLVDRYDAMRSVNGDPTCATMRDLAYGSVDERGDETRSGPAKCALQSVVSDGKGGPAHHVSASTCWPDPASAPAADPPLCYKLGFLEFDETGRLRSPEQLTRLRQVYTEGREIYTVIYVHGWRHDARLGDTDVRRLRVAASYASSHLLERCRVARTHCGAVVLAVYIEWPGSIGLLDGDAKAWAAFNFLTFASRKNVSDQIGGAVLAQLSDLYRASHAQGGDSSNRTLLLGHSLGGNLLLTAATPGLVAGFGRLATDLRLGAEDAAARDPLGLPADLTVLLNPASEAAKLDQLRRAEASLFATRSTRRSALPTFPDTTPPRLLMLSAGCGDLQMVRAGPDQHDVKCDEVVGTAFWASQIAEFHWGELQRIGIGHVALGRSDSSLRRLENMTVETNYQARGLPGFYERGVFAGSAIRPWYGWQTTTYAHARNRLLGTCAPESAWLVCARRRGTRTDIGCEAHDNSNRWQPWTAGDGSHGEVTLDRFAERGTPGQSNVQFQYGLARLGTGDWRAETQRADPIWAVQADLTAIAGHSQIASAPLLCSFDKLVLDEVLATDGRLPQDHVAATQAAWEARSAPAILQHRDAVKAQEYRWLATHPKTRGPPGR